MMSEAAIKNETLACYWILLLVAQAKLVASSPSHGGEGLLQTNGEERERVMIRFGRSSEIKASLSLLHNN
jgi:hypothetical protein